MGSAEPVNLANPLTDFANPLALAITAIAGTCTEACSHKNACKGTRHADFTLHLAFPITDVAGTHIDALEHPIPPTADVTKLMNT